MTWLEKVASVWRFVVIERLGYRRPPPLSDDDYQARVEMQREMSRLEDMLVSLDIRADIYTGRHKRQPR